MRTNQLISLSLALTFYFIGLIAAIFLPINLTGLFSGNLLIDAAAIVSFCFIVETALFGFIGFLPMLLLGILIKPIFLQKPFLFAFLLIPMALAIYSGNLFGESVWSELKEGKGIKDNWKKVLLLATIALVLALIIGYGFPMIEGMLPAMTFSI